MARSVPARLTASEGRKFAFPVGIAFCLLAGLLGWRGHVPALTLFLGMGSTLLLAGLLVPTRLGPAYRAWMALALVLSRVTTPIFMGIVYYLVITPTGLIMRLLGRNPMTRRPVDGSYWVRRPDGPGHHSDLKRQF